MTSLPDTMTAIEIATFGPPEGLRPGTRPMPSPGHGAVLIKVAAAGINRPDVMQRTGNYPPPPGASDIPGLEVAGEVVSMGPGVDSIAVGDKVCALVAGGGYAEYCVAPSVLCLPVPGNLSMAEAAALPETFFTVWTNVFQRGGLRGGRKYSDPRWVFRHWHNRDPVGSCFWRPGFRNGGQRREMPRL